MRKTTFSNIRDWMKNYNEVDLFLWIQTAAVHPANQLFQMRFELLLGILFSISPDEFSGNILARNEFESFIQSSDEKLSDHFLMFEDWRPFHQLKLIPYFFRKGKFYFFYGTLERPYEFLRQFNNLYLIDNSQETYNELTLIRQQFALSLEFQSQFVKILSESEGTEIDSEKIYVPRQEFFECISPLFRIEHGQLNDLENFPALEPGVFSYMGEKVFEACIDHNLFRSLYAHLSDSHYYFLLPQLHLEVLYNLANELLRSSLNKEQIGSLVFEDLISRLRRKCLQFFTVRKILAGILRKGTNRNLAEAADVIARIDASKIFLFKAAKHSFEIDLSEQIEYALNELRKAIAEIKEEWIIGLHYLNNEIIPVPSGEMEFWAVIVFESTTLDCKVKLPEDIDDSTWIVNMMDLQGIFEFLPSDLSLVKFLKNDRELLNKSRVFCTDYLDRFTYYIENGESYPRVGISLQCVTFAPHGWSDFYHEKLFEKHKDNIHELIEYEFPNTFNHIEKYSDNIYQVIDTGQLNGGLVVKYGEHLIWVLYPFDGFDSTEEEIQIYSGLIGPLYADYLNRLREPLTEFFRKHDFNFETNYYIGIYPASHVERTKQIQHLRPYLSKLSEGNPLIVITNRVSTSWNIRSCVIYDYQYLTDLFVPKENTGERFCIKQLIKSLVFFFGKDASEGVANSIAEEFVNRNIPIQTKGYSLEPVLTENPKLDDYRRHQDLSKADIAKVNREIAEFLAKSGEKPGEYHGDEAKRLNSLIFEFLEKKLENEIKQYNEGLLFYAYKEVELVEGRRAKSRIKFGMDASKYTEYDIAQKLKETVLEISAATNSAKYIIETMLKVGVNGSKIIDDESWHYLQAIALLLYETTIIYDYIHYDIQPHTLRISDLFEIEDIRGKEAFDHEEFYQAESELKLDSVKRDFTKHRETPRYEGSVIDEGVKPFHGLLQEINRVFKLELGFVFDNFVTVLYALGKMDLFHKYHFPLSLVSEETLISKLKENIRDSLNETEIQQILKFASLDFSTYKLDEELIPLHLLRRKERMNLCPLIHLDSGEYLYGNQMCLNASSLWLSSISSADFPYDLPQDSPIHLALANLHKRLDRELEKKAEEITKRTLGESNFESRIDNFKRLSPLFPRKPDCGEIDLLAVNRFVKTIYVLDAKNRSRKIRPYDMRNEMRKFFQGKRSYLAQLTKKEEFIKDNIEEVLRHFSIEDAESWQIRKAFVVKVNYPSAYIPEQNVDFVLIDNLEAYLTNGVN